MSRRSEKAKSESMLIPNLVQDCPFTLAGISFADFGKSRMSTTTPAFQHKVNVLEMMGAEELSIPSWSDTDILEHIQDVCQVPEQAHRSILDFCQGQIHRANLFVQDLALRGEMSWSEDASCFTIKSMVDGSIRVPCSMVLIPAIIALLIPSSPWACAAVSMP